MVISLCIADIAAVTFSLALSIRKSTSARGYKLMYHIISNRSPGVYLPTCNPEVRDQTSIGCRQKFDSELLIVMTITHVLSDSIVSYG